MLGWTLWKPRRTRQLQWLLILFHISVVVVSCAMQSIPWFPARHIGIKVQWQTWRETMCISPWHLCNYCFTTNYLTAPPTLRAHPLRENKWELYLTRNYVAGWVLRPRREQMCWNPVPLLSMSNAEMKGSLSPCPCNPAFFPLCWFCRKLSLPFVEPSCCLLDGYA